MAMRSGVFVALFVFGAASAQDDRGSVSRACDLALRRLSDHGISASFLAVDADGGDAVARRGSTRMLVPASAMKILPAAAALLGPGADHPLLTDLLLHGELRGETLVGCLRLRGEGDPTLRSGSLLPLLVKRLRDKGIRRVDGDLLVDDRLFDQEFVGAAWPDNNPTRPYMAEVAALSLDHGTVALQVSGGSNAGTDARVAAVPSGTVVLRGKITTCESRKREAVWSDRGTADHEIRIGGRCWLKTRGMVVPVAIHDPALGLGRAVRRALADGGVDVSGRVRRPRPGEHVRGGHLLVRVRTRVRDIVPKMLKSSQNHRAEMLFKHLGAVTVDDGSFAGGAAAVRSILSRHGVELGDCTLADGSGLSRDDRLSAHHLVAVLSAAWGSPARAALERALPYGGEPAGTLRRRLQDLGRRVRAKTGTLSDASALAGYVTTKGGRTVVFAVLCNGDKSGEVWRMRQAQDAVVRALARLRGGP